MPYGNPPISTTVLGSPDVGAVTYTDDGSIMAVGNMYGVIRLFNVATGLQIGTNLADPNLSGSRTPIRAHDGRVTSLDFSNDGTQLASGSHDDKVKLWTITTTGPTAGGVLAYTINNFDDVNAVAYSPDGSFLTSGGEFGLYFWDPTDGTEVGTGLTGVPPMEGISDISFFYDSTNTKLFLASGSYDNSAKVWEVTSDGTSGSLVRTLGHSESIYGIAYNHDGTVMAAGDNQGVIRLYNTATGAQIGSDLADPALVFPQDGLAHVYGVNAVTFNHEGTLLASSGDDDQVKLWTIDCTPSCATGDGGAWAQTLNDPQDDVNSVAFNHDSTLLASGDENDDVHVWTVSGSTATHVTTLTEPDDYVNAVDFNHDGTLLAAGDEDGDIEVWGINLTAGYVSPGAVRPATAPNIVHLESIDCTFDAANCHRDEIYTLAFSPDGSILAAGDEDEDDGSDDPYVRLWSVEPSVDSRIMGTTPSGPPAPSSYTFAYEGRFKGADDDWDDVTSLAFNDDGTRIVVGNTDNEVGLFNVSTPASPSRVGSWLLRPDEDINAVAFSPDGTRMAAGGGDNAVFIWKIASGDVDGLDRQIGFRGDVYAVAFSSLGIVAVADGGSGEEGTIRLFDSDGVPGTDLTDDDITADSGFWAHSDGNQDGVDSLDFKPGGTELASGGRDNVIKTWSITGTEGLLNKDFLYGHQDRVNDVEYSPDGNTLLSSSEDGSYRLWDPATSTLEVMYGMAGGDDYDAGGITAMAFSADGSLLAMGDENGVIQLYDTTTWLPVGLPLADPGFDTTSNEGRAYQGVVRGLAFHPTTGQLISAGYDNTAGKGRIKYWDISLTGGSYSDAFDAFNADLGALALSPNGSMLAVGGQYNGTFKLFNTSTQAQVGSDLTNHTSGIESLEFSSSGTQLVSSGGDNSAKIWNVGGSGATFSQTLAHSDVKGAVFSPDGATVITAGGNGSNIRRWNASSGAQIGTASHPNYIRSLAMAPDGGAVAIVDYQGGTAAYDASDLSILGLPLDEHYGSGLNAVAFSPNGGYLATVGEDNSLAVWGYTICPAN